MQLIKACLLDMRHSYINLRKNSGGGGKRLIIVFHITINDEKISETHLFIEVTLIQS